MKFSGVTNMIPTALRRSALLLAWSVATILLPDNQGIADVLHFRVAFENVPGAQEIEAGNLKAGIRVLEDRLNDSEQDNRGPLLATLCAAYIIDDAMRKAEHVCNKAVETNATASAYNNRGVFRASTGDYFGARMDFARVRPRRLETYLENLKKSNPPLIAADNFHLIDALMIRHASTPRDPVLAIDTVTIEDLSQ